jgi:hypothetical protein
MGLVLLDNRHGNSVLPAFSHSFARLIGRIVRSDNERMPSMTRRLLRRRRRQVSDLARLLVALDTLAGDSRPWPPRRVRRASLGAARL